MSETVSHGVDPSPLARLAERGCDSFCDFAEISDTTSKLISRNYFRFFNWTRDMDLFSPYNSSLDYKLRASPETIQTVQHLLETILHLLQQGMPQVVYINIGNLVINVLNQLPTVLGHRKPACPSNLWKTTRSSTRVSTQLWSVSKNYPCQNPLIHFRAILAMQFKPHEPKRYPTIS